MKTTACLVLLVGGALATACSSYSPDLGAVPFACGSSDPQCPDGYTCTPVGGSSQMVCVQAGGDVPDGGAGGQCQDDSNLEPNNDIQHAYVLTSLPAGGLKLAGLAICPAGDKDTFAVNPTAMSQTLAADLEYDSAQTALAVNILASTGSVAVASQPNGTGKAKATLVNVPFGGSPTYVQVISATGSGTNGDYKLTLTLQ